MEHLAIANSPALFAAIAVLLIGVFVMAFAFFRMASARAMELGVEKSTTSKVIRSAATTSIIPSVAIILGLMTLIPVLGVPVAWGRLSIVGSLMYEVLTATVGATSAGAEGLGRAGFTPEAWANSVWIMTIGVIPGLLLATFALKKYKETISKATAKNALWQGVFVGTIMIAVFANFSVPAIFKGGDDLLAVVVSAATMGLLTLISKKSKASWLGEYSLSLSIIMALVAIIVKTAATV